MQMVMITVHHLNSIIARTTIAMTTNDGCASPARSDMETGKGMGVVVGECGGSGGYGAGDERVAVGGGMGMWEWEWQWIGV